MTGLDLSKWINFSRNEKKEILCKDGSLRFTIIKVTRYEIHDNLYGWPMTLCKTEEDAVKMKKDLDKRGTY